MATEIVKGHDPTQFEGQSIGVRGACARWGAERIVERAGEWDEGDDDSCSQKFDPFKQGLAMGACVGCSVVDDEDITGIDVCCFEGDVADLQRYDSRL